MRVNDFWIGQRVKHSSRGLGFISKMDRQGMHVAFDDHPKYPGIYDDLWFESCCAHGVTISSAKPEHWMARSIPQDWRAP